MNRTIFITAAMLLVGTLAQAQAVVYPVLLLPRETFQVPAESDTVFVISRAQMEASLLKAESLAVADSTVAALERKAALLGETVTEQQGIIDTQTGAYEHYRDLWAETDHDLEEAEVKVDKYKRDRWRWSIISAVVLGLTGFAIGSAVN